MRVRTATTPAPKGAFAVSQQGNWVEVAVPGGVRVGSLALSGLCVAGETELRSSGDLSEAGLRLVVSTKVGGARTPLCAVPDFADRGVLPAQLKGASFANGVLTLPDPAAPALQLVLAGGDTPEGLTLKPTRLGGALGTAAIRSGDLKLTDPAGVVVWEFPGELPAAEQSIDLGTPLRLALEAALAAGHVPDVTFLLLGAAGMRAVVSSPAAHGALLRRQPGTVKVELQGDPVALELEGPALAAETPSTAQADVAIRYRGIRLHEAVRDPLPPRAGGVGGEVVGEAPVVRALPPAALRDHPVAMVAPVGRTPEGCALSVELVDLTSGPPGVPLGPPGTIELSAGASLSAPWVEMPPAPPSGTPPGVRVRATAGRFLWAAGPDGVPLVRLAVSDPTPGGGRCASVG